VAVVVFVFLAPVFFWFTQYTVTEQSQPPVGVVPQSTSVSAYHSVGCMVFGYGVAYFTRLVALDSGQSQGLVFTCRAPPPAWPSAPA
jgi:ABC-type spermidine/putrescine transport system permease subunit I